MKKFSLNRNSRNIALETASYYEKEQEVMKQNKVNNNIEVNRNVIFLEKEENNKHNKKLNNSRYKVPNNISRIMQKKQQSYYVLITVCFIFLVSTFVSAITWTTNWYQHAVYKTLVFDEYSLNLNLWKNPTWQPLLNVYIFNYTNMESVLEGREKPNVQEVGPYVFREKSKKVNVTFYSNGTVSYRVYRECTFLPELSSGSMNDTIRTPNMVLFSAASELKGRSGIKYLLNFMSMQLFIDMPVGNLTMGYEDMHSKVGSLIGTFMGKGTPSKLGLLKSRIGLSKDMITMHTGKNNMDLYGVYEHINGNSNLNKWNDKACDKLNGTDGTIYPPTLLRNRKTLTAFSDGSCRVSNLFYRKKVKSRGLETLQYVMDPNAFQYPKQPNKSCFCLEDRCPNGIQTISPCLYGSPIFVSYPHFITADKEVQEGVSGLNKDFKEQINYFNIHETLGVLISGKTGIQLNVQAQNTAGISALNGIKEGTYLPVAWIQMDLTSPPENMIQMIYFTTCAIKYSEIFLKYGCIIIAIVSLLGVIKMQIHK